MENERATLAVSAKQRARLQSELRYEAADGDEFPHPYGALNLDAVVQVIDFEPAPTGFELPPELVPELAKEDPK